MQTLRETMDLAGQCCLAWLDSEKDFLPTGGYEAAHDTGRWWDAMLRREAATGIAIPAEAEGAMLRNLQALTANPDGLLLNPDRFGMQVFINPHNFREALIAFHALVRYRSSVWAAEAGHRLLLTMDRLWQPDGRLDYTKLHCWGSVPHTEDPSHAPGEPGQWFDATANTGRALEAIVWFYEATGDPLALSLAARIAPWHLEHTLSPDGATRPEILDPSNVGHNHSYLGTLRGLVLYGLLTGQREYVDTVARTYRRSFGVNNVTESGYTPHDLGKTRFPNADGVPVGETASCGDIVQLALWLALRDGQLDLLDDVERLVRARILPSQITPERFPDLAADPRQRGAWGVYSDPYGVGSTHDVFAAVLHTLTDVEAHVVTREALGLGVNLHFTTERPDVWVRAERGVEARLSVTPRATCCCGCRAGRRGRA